MRPPIGGTFSAENGNIGNNQQSHLDLAVRCGAGAMVTFTYQTSTEGSFDFLRFRVDGAGGANWSGTTGPTTVMFPLTAGAHTLRWSYTKDGSVSSGMDSVWIDDISITDCTAS